METAGACGSGLRINGWWQCGLSGVSATSETTTRVFWNSLGMDFYTAITS